MQTREHAEHVARLLEALQRPAAYGHLQSRPQLVTVRQTHISMLFFVGNRVYKVKKPVDMGFLDYRELATRRHFCHEEVRLNRRLSPDMYFGVRCVVEDADGMLRVGEEDDPAGPVNVPAGRVVEYAVEMVRLPAERMLAALVERGEIDNAQMDAVAKKLVAFHRECPTGRGVDEHASPEALRGQVDETTAKLGQFVPAMISEALHAKLAAWCDACINSNTPLLLSRQAGGRIREGHGDLHTENICILREPLSPEVSDAIVIYDCIEFTRRYRCRDVACEIAFLAMDMDYRGVRAFAQYLVRRYAEFAEDEPLCRLLPFYKACLAQVRAMVEAMKSVEPEIGEPERQSAAERSRRYTMLAATYAIGPALIIMCGLPGSGKSWAARAIAHPFEAAVIRSDETRKRLAGLGPTQNAAQLAPYVYEPAWTQRTYSAMLERAKEEMRSGRAVVVDATFAASSLREPFTKAAEQLRVPWVLVMTEAADEEIRRRMESRKGDAVEVSDADWHVYQRARERWSPPNEVPKRRCVHVTSPAAAEDVASRVIEALLVQVSP